MELGSATAQTTKINAAVAARLRALDLAMLACEGRDLDGPDERLAYVAVLALGRGAMHALQLAHDGTPIDQRLAACVVRAFAARVGRVLAAGAGDVVLERLARYVDAGRGFDA